MKETQQAEAVASRLTRPDQTSSQGSGQAVRLWVKKEEEEEKEKRKGSLYLYAVQLLLLFWAAKKKCAAKSENPAKVLTTLPHA